MTLGAVKEGVPFARRAGWHAAFAWRAVRFGVAIAAVAGLGLRLLLPVEGAWIAAAVAGACIALGILLVGIERSALPQPGTEGAALELLGTVGQWAQAFLRSAFVLAAFAAGLVLAALLGLGRA